MMPVNESPLRGRSMQVGTLARAAAVGGLSCSLACLCALLASCGGAPTPATSEPEPNYVTRQSEPLIELSRPPEPLPARPFTLPNIETRVLENGLRVVLVDRPGFPTVSLRLTMGVGSGALGGDVASAELVARLLRDGAGELDAVAIAEWIDRSGIQYGARSGVEAIRISADAIATQLDAMVELVALLVSEPTFPEDRVEARKGEYAAELERQRAQPSFHLERTVRRALFGDGTPLGVYAPSNDAITAVDRDRLVSIWAERFGPATATLVVVGQLPAGASDDIAAAFGVWSGGAAHGSAPSVSSLVGASAVATCNLAHVVIRPGSAQTAIAWLGAGAHPNDRDYFDALVANQVVGGGPSARLFMNLREEKSFTYGAYSGLEPWGDMSIFRATSNVRTDVTVEALDEFARELARFADDPLDDIDDAKAWLMGVFPIELQTNAQLAGRVASLLDQGVELEFLERYREHVAETSETDVRGRGARLFDPTRLTLVLVGEEDVAVAAARRHAGRVQVYDLEGTLLNSFEGDVASTCAAEVR